MQNKKTEVSRTEQVSAEKKMRLAQYIRAENMDNRMKIRQREKILYGTENNMPPLWEKKESIRGNDYLWTNEDSPDQAPDPAGTFRLRMAAAILLFIGFLLCDAGQYKVFGYSMNDIYGMISEDYLKLYDTGDAMESPQLSELWKPDFAK